MNKKINYTLILFFALTFSQIILCDEIPYADLLIESEPSEVKGDITNWKRVYLATYPRSGNHWMRFLIEEITGVATSSVYRDPDPKHDPNPYPWEAYSIEGGYIQTARFPTEDDLVFIKTHYPALHLTERDLKPAVKTLRIIRHPIDSFYSHYCYRHEPPEIIPTEWITAYVHIWSQFQNYWNEQPDVISIRYEDLMNQPYEQLRHTAKAVGLEISDDTIMYAVNTHPPFGEPLKHSGRYTQEQLEFIDLHLKETMKKFGYTILSVDPEWSPKLIGQYE